MVTFSGFRFQLDVLVKGSSAAASTTSSPGNFND